MWVLCGLEAPRYLEQDLQRGEVWHAGQSQPDAVDSEHLYPYAGSALPTERAHCLKEISSN